MSTASRTHGKLNRLASDRRTASVSQRWSIASLSRSAGTWLSTGWAIAIQGYIRLARRFYDEGHDLSSLENLGEPHEDDGKHYNFFAWNNPVFQRAGIVVPAVTKKGEKRLTARNSHQTRRAMAEVMAKKVGLPPPPETRPVELLDLLGLAEVEPAE